MRNAPVPTGMVTALLLSIVCAFECIVNAFFCCLDIYMTNNLVFTLSLEVNFFDLFLKYVVYR